MRFKSSFKFAAFTVDPGRDFDGSLGARSGRSLTPRTVALGDPFSHVIVACPPPYDLARGFMRKLMPMRLMAFMAAIVRVRSTRSFSPNTANAAE